MVVEALKLQRDSPGPLGGGRRPRVERCLDGCCERPAHGDGTEALSSLDVEERIARCAAAEPPLQAAVLVPGEQVQVDDFLAAGDEAVVQGFDADLADRPERELERVAAYRVRRVDLARFLPGLVPQPG